MEGGYEHHMLLPGQRFCPTEDELLMYYLKPKVNGKEVPGEGTLICEVDFYGEEEPWSIWERFEAERANDLRRNKDLYFFTKKKKVSAKASRNYRKIGRGTWKGQDAAKEIYLVDQNHQQTRTLLGFKKTYTYRNKKSEHHGGWIMYEYELDESQFMNKKQGPEDYVENDEGDNMEPESVVEEPQEKRQRLLPRTNNVPGPSSSEDVAAELEQWIDFDQQYYKPAPLPLEAYTPAEPQPAEENLGQQYQMHPFSANEINQIMNHNFHHENNQMQQVKDEEGIRTSGEGDLYGGNSSDAMGGGAYWPQSFMDGLNHLMNDEQPSTMGVWNDDSYLDFGAYAAD
ncbi:NAC domain-containing protein 45-like [Argentina anserina]|uniref:NAC domain-containing protein 45-like n=1 Tax=Argentina anserina TaxID=57926 RepID=UPI0021766DED|nr:NAC domain-containing protein 45-like [Potentilla anserina]